MKRKIPNFKSIEEERKFWETHNVTDYLGELKPVQVEFPQPKHIVLDLKPRQLTSLKQLAFKKGISSSRLLKRWIAEKLSKEAAFSH